MFCHIFEKYQGYFFAKKGGGGVFAKFENYLGTFLRWRGWVVVKGMIFENPSCHMCHKKVLPPPPPGYIMRELTIAK